MMMMIRTSHPVWWTNNNDDNTSSSNNNNNDSNDASRTTTDHTTSNSISPTLSSSSAAAFPWSDASALCIVPPDQVWDTIQRARYIAQDSTYAIWPPAIRLFHPFPDISTTSSSSSSFNSVHDPNHSNIVFDIANMMEAYNISTFPITLSEWSIIPHIEKMNDHPKYYLNDHPPSSSHQHSDDLGVMDPPGGVMMTSTVWQQPQQRYFIPNEDDQKVQALIRSVEQLGKQKLLVRQEKAAAILLKQQQQQQQQNSSNNSSHTSTLESDPTLTGVTSRGPSASSSNAFAGSIPDVHAAKRAKRKKNSDIRKYNSNNDDDNTDVYNGPCVICLEPDAISKRRIQQLRHLLQRQLFPTNGGTMRSSSSSSFLYTSPTGSVLSSSSSSNSCMNRNNMGMEQMSLSSSSMLEEYRPVVPIAAFPNVNSAIQVAKQLRSLWKPLTFNITDLHIISSSSPSRPGAHDDTTTVSKQKVTQHQQPQYGCDALITLMGVPLPTDDNYCHESDDDDDIGSSNRDENDHINTTEIVQLLCEFGEPGGYDWKRSNHSHILLNTSAVTTSAPRPNTVPVPNKFRREEDHDANDDSRSDTTTTTTVAAVTTSTELEQWLYGEDDEYDEGTVVILGRTQFFTGEMRQYVGMPATSAFLGTVNNNNNVDD